VTRTLVQGPQNAALATRSIVAPVPSPAAVCAPAPIAAPVCAPAPMIAPAMAVAPAPAVGLSTGMNIAPTAQARPPVPMPAELEALINAMQDRVDAAYLAKDYPQRHRHRHT
jgi:hypothetical protein